MSLKDTNHNLNDNDNHFDHHNYNSSNHTRSRSRSPSRSPTSIQLNQAKKGSQSLGRRLKSNLAKSAPAISTSTPVRSKAASVPQQVQAQVQVPNSEILTPDIQVERAWREIYGDPLVTTYYEQGWTTITKSNGEQVSSQITYARVRKISSGCVGTLENGDKCKHFARLCMWTCQVHASQMPPK